MITVVLCHFLCCCVTKDDTVVRAFILFIYYFHMPLFVFISGYFSKNTEKCRETAFRNLFMVFLIAQVFWAIFKFITCGSVHYFRYFLDPGYAIWYIVSLFFWRLLLKDLIRVRHILLISFFLSPVVMFLSNADALFAVNKTVGFLFFFLLGYYTTEKQIRLIRKIPKLAALGGLVLIFGLTFYAVNNGIFLYGQTKAILLHIENLRSFPHIWEGLCAYYQAIILAVICSVLVIAAIPEKKTFLAFIGKDTMPLYLSHTYFLIFCDMLLSAFSFSPEESYAVALGMCAVVIAGCSTPPFRKIFHTVYDTIIGCFYPKSIERKSSAL